MGGREDGCKKDCNYVQVSQLFLSKIVDDFGHFLVGFRAAEKNSRGSGEHPLPLVRQGLINGASFSCICA